jgi:AbiV family abortive infection protein
MPKKTPPTPMTAEQLHAFRSALLENAGSLVDDAQLLAAAGRYPRVLALSVLAIEETTKIDIVWALLMQLRQGTEPSWDALHSVGLNHKAKLMLGPMLAEGTAFVLSQDPPRKPDDEWLKDVFKKYSSPAENLDTKKQSALYVTLDAGTAVTPCNLVGKELALHVLTFAQDALNSAKKFSTLAEPLFKTPV